MDSISTAVTGFINSQAVLPLYSLAVISFVTFLLAIYRSIQGGTFDFQKLPQILDTLVLRKVVPLAALGAAGFLVTDGTTKDALTAAYLAGCAAALAGEVTNLIQYVINAVPESAPPTLAVTPGGTPTTAPASTDGVRLSPKR